MTPSPWPLGLMTALVTPMRDQELNLDTLQALVDFQVEVGVAGLVIGGGTGEYGALRVDERISLAREAVRAADGRVPVVVQTGALATRDAIALSREAEASGAVGLLVASPFGEPINWRERRRFYEQVDASVTLPIMIYNTPPSGILSLEQIQDLAELPNVGAVKDSSGDHVLVGDLLAWSEATDFKVYVGADTLLYDAICAGARGAVLGMGSFAPEPISDLLESLGRDGPTDESSRLWRRLRPLLRFMEESLNYIALCKAGCHLRGLDVGDVRLPYLMPPADELSEFARMVREAGIAR